MQEAFPPVHVLVDWPELLREAEQVVGLHVVDLDESKVKLLSSMTVHDIRILECRNLTFWKAQLQRFDWYANRITAATMRDIIRELLHQCRSTTKVRQSSLK